MSLKPPANPNTPLHSPALITEQITLGSSTYDVRDDGIPNVANAGNLDYKLAVGDVVSDSDSTKNRFIISSYVFNDQAQPCVALFGMGKGNHVFGANLVAYGAASGDTSIGLEIDFGNLVAGGTSTGLLIKSLGGNVGGDGGQAYIQMQAQTSSEADNGIIFQKSGSYTAVASTGALIKASAESCTFGLSFSGSTFTTAASYLTLNSGSTASSAGLLIAAEGGFANAGSFIDIRSGAASSTGASGILFRVTGGRNPVVSTGSLITTSASLACAVGLNFANAAFTTAGISMGDNDISVGTTTGMKIGTAASQKLGFWNKTPIVQPNTTGETVGFTAGAGTGVKDDSTFTGNVGSTAYRISDIVKHLKNMGLIAS